MGGPLIPPSDPSCLVVSEIWHVTDADSMWMGAFLYDRGCDWTTSCEQIIPAIASLRRGRHVQSVQPGEEVCQACGRALARAHAVLLATVDGRMGSGLVRPVQPGEIGTDRKGTIQSHFATCGTRMLVGSIRRQRKHGLRRHRPI